VPSYGENRSDALSPSKVGLGRPKLVKRFGGSGPKSGENCDNVRCILYLWSIFTFEKFGQFLKNCPNSVLMVLLWFVYHRRCGSALVRGCLGCSGVGLG